MITTVLVMVKKQKVSTVKDSEQTSKTQIVNNTLKGFQLPKMETSSSYSLKTLTYNSISSTESQDYFNVTHSYYYSYLQFGNKSNSHYDGNNDNVSSTTSSVDRKISCLWEPAQHNLFQLTNMCFLSAFVLPRNYKSGILVFR